MYAHLRRLGLGLSLVGVVSCSARDSAPETADASTNVAPFVPVTSSPALAIIGSHPALDAVLQNALPLRKLGTGFDLPPESAPPSANGWSPAGNPQLVVQLPDQSQGATHISLRDDEAAWLEVQPADVAPVAASVEPRALVFAKVATDTDLVHVASRAVVEEFRVLRTDRAPTSFRWSLHGGPRVGSIQVSDGRIEIRDRDARALFMAAPPFAIDAKGSRRDLDVKLEESAGSTTLTASLDTRDLEYPIVVDPAWTATNSMSTARKGPYGGLLTSGKIVVAGGTNASGTALSSAEVWDPATGNWSAAGTMSNPHGGGGSTVYGGKLLVVGGSVNTADSYDGTSWSASTMAAARSNAPVVVYMPSVSKVLVAGGYVGSTQVSTAETFNGTSWSNVTSMSVTRDAAGGAWLPTKNKVLVFGGTGGSPFQVHSTAELYDPATNTWAPTGALPEGWYTASALTLPDGRVLAHSGYPAATATMRIYDPATGTWSSVGGVMPKFRAATVLTTGMVLFAGANISSSNYQGTTDLFDPTLNTFTAASLMVGQCAFHALVAFPGGKALAAGGACGNTASANVATAEVFQAQPNGQTCGANGDCTSKLCVDGVCCNSSCTSICQACDNAGSLGTCSAVTGAPHGSRGTCGTFVCQGSGTTCPSTCSSDAGCASGYFCSGSTCVAKKTNGSTCPTGGHECTSGSCADGYCCTTACTSGCEACDVSGSVGTCSTVTGAPHGARTCGAYLCSGSSSACPSSCAADGECSSGYYCNGSNCVAKKSNGNACPSGAHECSGGTCVDGYCCNSSCGSSCQACDVSGSLGACTNVTGSPHGARTSCGTFTCQGTTASCPTTCTNDGGCASGSFCSGGVCITKKANGLACPTGAHECSNGNCVDGVCCNTACAGQCEACDAATTVGTCVAVTGAPHSTRTACGGTGVCQAQCNGIDRLTCGAYPAGIQCAAASCSVDTATPARTCDGAGNCASAPTTKCDPYLCGPTACKASCTSGADCKSGYFCNGTSCVTTGAAGTVCSLSSQCASGNCVDGVCCTVSSCTAPLKCNAKGDGTCSKPLGTTCSSAAECGSGSCVDGVCCNAACGGQCEACDVSGSVGQCVPVAGAPHGGRTTCSGTGVCKAVCNGSDRTVCGAYPGSSTVCVAASCTSGIASSTRTCDGTGNCAPATTNTCNPYVCSGTTCRLSCAADADCASGYFCSGSSCVPKLALAATCTGGSQCQSGNCVDGVCCSSASCSAGLKCNAKGDGTCSKPLGISCSAATECGSGMCVDGVCCNSTCTGQCEACDIGGSLGTCIAVAGTPHGSRTACTGTGTCQASCTGSDRTKCGAPPGTGAVCAAATCASGSATPTRTCDGLGSCAPVSAAKCDPYVCGGAACKTNCAGDSDCASGYFCSGTTCTTTGNLGTVCTSAAQCKSGNCVDGVCCTTSSCASGLKCNAKGDGTCSKPLGSSCTSEVECGSGFCADGVCCNAGCTGQCEACDVGGSIGTCIATVGTPHGPRTACGGAGVCQSSCNGSDRTKCGSYPGISTPCAAARCTVDKAYGTAYCDGLGSCPAPTPSDCGAFTCGTVSCKTSCSATTDCKAGYACKAGACVSTAELGTVCDDDSQCKSGHCTAAGLDKKVCCKEAACGTGSACADASLGTLAGSCLKSAGQSCAGSDSCLSGFCVDGVCCESICGGQCEACDVPGALGKCTAVNGAPHGARTSCSDGGTDLCKALSCDGSKDRTKCTAYANGLDKECAPASCTDDTSLEASFCDGSGSCRKTTGKSCAPYACGDKACKTGCTADTDCAKASVCDGGKCVAAKPKCTDDGLSSVSADKTSTKTCGTYRCNPASGDCYNSCTASDQCAAPSVCDGARCVPAPEGGTDDGGGCSTSHGPSRTNAGFGLVLLALAAVSRRRRAARN